MNPTHISTTVTKKHENKPMVMNQEYPVEIKSAKGYITDHGELFLTLQVEIDNK